jgi:hypothetical protein
VPVDIFDTPILQIHMMARNTFAHAVLAGKDLPNTSIYTVLGILTKVSGKEDMNQEDMGSISYDTVVIQYYYPSVFILLTLKQHILQNVTKS